jgi:four helix bundle protein
MQGLVGFDAYRVALELYRLVLSATKHLPKCEVDQLVRACESVARNIGEAHPQIGAERARKFRIAFGEASECGAALDLLEIRGALDGRALVELRALLDRQRAMLWRLSRG